MYLVFNFILLIALPLHLVNHSSGIYLLFIVFQWVYWVFVLHLLLIFCSTTSFENQ